MARVVTRIIRNEAQRILSRDLFKKDMREATTKGIRDGLAILEDTHKRKVVKRGSGAPVKKVWTVRRGSRGLIGTYKRDFTYGHIQGSYGSTHWLAGVQEFGKTIHARNAPYLKFKTHDGKWHMVKKVVLPPRPTLAIALAKSKKRREKVMDKYLNAALARKS